MAPDNPSSTKEDDWIRWAPELVGRTEKQTQQGAVKDSSSLDLFPLLICCRILGKYLPLWSWTFLLFEEPGIQAYQPPLSVAFFFLKLVCLVARGYLQKETSKMELAVQPFIPLPSSCFVPVFVVPWVGAQASAYLLLRMLVPV